MKQNNEQTTNKKSFRKFVAEHKVEIIAGVTVIAAGSIGYLVYKNNKNAKDIKLLGMMVNRQTDLQQDMVELAKLELECDKGICSEVDIVKDIAKEGALEEAIKSVKRKIQYRVGKIENCTKTNTPEALLSKQTYERELIILEGKLELFEQEWENMIH